MAKTPPGLKQYPKQQDSQYVSNARRLMEQGYKGLEEYTPKVNTMSPEVQSDINSRLGSIYNRAKSDFDIDYRDTMGKTLANEYGKFGTTGGTSSLYRTDMANRTAQRALADLAYNKAENYENDVDRELARRYNTINMYKGMYGYGQIPQKYDDQNYQLEKENIDRAYQNDLDNWNTQQNLIGTGTNLGIDALSLGASAFAPQFAPIIMGLSSSLKPSISGLVAPNANNPVGGMSSKQAGGWADLITGKVPTNNSTGGIFGNTQEEDFMQWLRRLFSNSSMKAPYNTRGSFDSFNV